MFGPLGLSLAPYVRSSRTLSRWFIPMASWYANLVGHRQMGLKYDDLLREECPEVQRALQRLTPAEAYDRAFRIKRASQASVVHKPLPSFEHIKPEEDVRYLTPKVQDVMEEEKERHQWDTMTVHRK